MPSASDAEPGRSLAGHAELKVAAHGAHVEPPSAGADARAQRSAAHAAVAQGDREIAVDVAAHRRHGKVRRELARHLERHVAAHGAELEVAVARELVDAD